MDTPMTPPPVPRSAWIAGALVLALILGWVAWSHQPQLSPGPDGGFDTARAGALLEALLKEGVPHPAGSEAGRVVAGRVEETLRGLGFQVQRQELQSPPLRNSPPVTLVNIVGRLKGREPGPALLLAAHHDSVPAGPGAGDDGAGTAVVLEVARILAARGTRRDVIVLISDGEEVGLLGAAAFAMQHPWFKDAGAVLNLDNRGAAGPCHVFEIGAGEASLVPLLEGIPRPSTSSLASFVYRQMHNNSDFTIWRNAGLAGFNLAFIGDGHRYHTAEDTPANLHRGTLEHMGRTALLLATALDAGEPRSAVAVPELQATFRKAWEGDPAARSAVYQGALAPVDPAPVAFISVLNRWVVHWPASWSRWFAGAACLLVLASAFRAWRKGWFGCLGWWGTGTNPEQLFSVGYSACYLGALKFVAGKEKLKISDDAKVSANVGIGERDDKEGFGLVVELMVSLPGIDKAKAEELTKKAHVVCPYSHATKGNISVTTKVV